MHVGNTKYCWIALGAHSRQCPVHENFKCIVIVDKDRALQPAGLPPPFLNRFVKLMLTPSDIINKYEASGTVESLSTWMAACAAPFSVEQAFVGYHQGFTQSLVLAVIAHLETQENFNEIKRAQGLIIKAKEWALLTATLETGMHLEEVDEGRAFADTYRRQPHLNLAQLCTYAKQNKWDTDGGGLQLVVLTHSTRLHQLERAIDSADAHVLPPLHLMNITSEHELMIALADFWSTSDLSDNTPSIKKDDDTRERYLIVTAHVPACSDDRLSHFKFLCSRERARFVQNQGNHPPRHVIILRLLPRVLPVLATSTAASLRKQSSAVVAKEAHKATIKIDVEQSFRHVYLDNVLSGNDTGEPELEQMHNQSIADILKQQSIVDKVLPNLIRREYRRVLNQLHFSPAVVAAGKISEGHAALIAMMERLLDEKPFVEGLVYQLVHVMQASEEEGAAGGGTVPWQAKLVREHASSREGSLRAAFYQYFVSSITKQLALLLARIGANSNLQLLDNTMSQNRNHPLVKLWLTLLSTPGLWPTLGGGAGIIGGGVPMKTNIGRAVEVEQQINATFPFSSAVMANVELLRHDAEATAREREAECGDPLVALEEAVQKLIENGKLSKVASEWNPQLAERYLADFVKLQIHRSGTVGAGDLAKRVLETLLHAALEQAGLELQLSSIHAAYWFLESFTSELLVVLNVLLGSGAALNFDLRKTESVLPLVHQQLAVIRLLIATVQLPTDNTAIDQEVRSWAARCADIRRGIESLLGLMMVPVVSVRNSEDDDNKEEEEEEDDDDDDEEDLERARKELSAELTSVMHQWQIVQLLADFHRIVVVPLQLPALTVFSLNSLLMRKFSTVVELGSDEAIKALVLFLRKDIAIPAAEVSPHWRKMSQFVEEFLLNAFLPAMLKSSNNTLALHLLARSLSGKGNEFFVVSAFDQDKDSDYQANGIELTSSARYAIIRWLLAKYENANDWNNSGVRNVLDNLLDIKTDHPLAVLYLECFEDWLESKAANSAYQLKENAMSIYKLRETGKAIDLLQTIAMMRLILRLLADELHNLVLIEHPHQHQQEDEAEPNQMQRDPALVRQRQLLADTANELVQALTGPTAGNLPLSQSILHLARELAQRNGLQLAKAILCSTPAQTLLPWLAGANISHLLVVGRDNSVCDSVPAVDAFELLQVNSYAQLRDALEVYLQVPDAVENQLTASPLPYGLFPALYRSVRVFVHSLSPTFFT